MPCPLTPTCQTKGIKVMPDCGESEYATCYTPTRTLGKGNRPVLGATHSLQVTPKVVIITNWLL